MGLVVTEAVVEWRYERSLVRGYPNWHNGRVWHMVRQRARTCRRSERHSKRIYLDAGGCIIDIIEDWILNHSIWYPSLKFLRLQAISSSRPPEWRQRKSTFRGEKLLQLASNRWSRKDLAMQCSTRLGWRFSCKFRWDLWFPGNYWLWLN